MGIRDSLDKPIGAIISDLFNESELKNMFEGKGGVPPELEGLSSGDIAIRMGLIDQETKTALLVAQSAERTLRMADKIVTLAETGKDTVKEQFSAMEHSGTNAFVNYAAIDASKLTDGQALGYARYNDPIFKFVGSDRDPELLKEAQATWQLANIYMSYEANSLREEILSSPGFTFDGIVIGTTYVEGFRRDAVSHFNAAAQILEDKGHEHIAKQLREASASIPRDKTPAIRDNSPRSCAHFIIWENGNAEQNTIIALGEGYVVPGPNDYIDTLKKLGALARAPEQKPAQQAAARKMPSGPKQG